MQQTIHEKLFTLEITDGQAPRLREPQILGNLTPAGVPGALPSVASLPEQDGWLRENALSPFIEEIRKDRSEELQRIADHVDLSLTEVLRRTDLEVGGPWKTSESRSRGPRGAWPRPRTGTLRPSAGGNAAGGNWSSSRP